jgi:hypothetical protein
MIYLTPLRVQWAFAGLLTVPVLIHGPRKGQPDIDRARSLTDGHKHVTIHLAPLNGGRKMLSGVMTHPLTA